MRATKPLGQTRHLNRCRKILGIDFLDFGRVSQMRAALVEPFQIARQIPGIGDEILGRAKLQRVDENAHHHAIRHLPRPPHKAEMPFVQISHRGHERDALPRLPHLIGCAVHCANRCYDFDDHNTSSARK